MFVGAEGRCCDFGASWWAWNELGRLRSFTIEDDVSFRVVICVGFVRAIGCWPTIAASGLIFGVLHVVYGNPSPENLVGGLFLAWAFLKSESIVVPLILHSAGNAIVLAGQVGGWYVNNGGV